MAHAASTLIFGCGYLGERVATRLVERGDPVYGTTRNPQRANVLASRGIQPVIADVTQPETLDALPRVDRILYCIGFDRKAGKSIREVYVDGFQSALDAIGRDLPGCPIVYASSTGVYGGNDGDWVDETSPVDPQTESGQACWDAEQILTGHEVGKQGGAILRFAGLYGPDRIMRRESLKRGEPVVGNPDKFLNFIQIDDAAAVTIRMLEELTNSLELYLVSDGRPIVRSQFYTTVAELLHAPPPRFESPEPGSPAALREDSNKRIRNRKLVSRWSEILRYPEIRDGLKASLAGSSDEPSKL